MPTDDAFADVLAANKTYAAGYQIAEHESRAVRGLGVLTMESRIHPLAMLGLAPRRRQDSAQRGRPRHRRRTAHVGARLLPPRRRLVEMRPHVRSAWCVYWV